MFEPLTIALATESDRARWNEYVSRDSNASVYHRFEWGSVFARAYQNRFFPIMASRGGAVAGVLPLFLVERHPFASELVSVPYFGHGGAIALDDEAWRGLIAKARELRRDVGAAHVELRHAHTTLSVDLPARTDKALMILPLDRSVREFEARVGSKIRADVRRPMREGLQAIVGAREGVGAFFDVYADVMRSLGSPCHSAAIFDETIAAFPDRAFIVRVLYQGRTVGAAILVGEGDTLEVPCAGTLHSVHKLRANMLLYWAILREAIERGYRRFSFGRSTVGAGTYQFKRNWGASPVPLSYHYLVPPDVSLPRAHEQSAWLQRASAVWKHLPLAVTNQLGPHIVRHLA